MVVSNQNLVELLTNFFEKRSDIKIAILFGSAAKGRVTKASDIDVAIAASTSLSIDQRVDMANELSSLVQSEVDLVDLNQVSGLILKEVLTKGVVLKKIDDGLFAGFMRKFWYNQADMIPYTNYILRERRRKFLDG